MKIVQKDVFSKEERKELWQLRNDEYPIQFGHETFEEFELYCNAIVEQKNYALIDHKNKIQGWAYTFFRDNEIWFAIMLNYQFQGKGFGRILLEELKNNNTDLNGWVIDHENDIKRNQQKYISPVRFYILNDFSVLENTRIENEKISAVKIHWRK